MKVAGIIMMLALMVGGCATDRSKVILAGTTEKCDAPIWEVGDMWQHANQEGRYSEMQVMGKETINTEEVYIVRNRAGNSDMGISTKTLALRMDIDKATGRKFKPITTWQWEYDFPLYVGKKWGRTVTGTSAGGLVPMNYFMTYRVRAFEDVTVQAGVFKAFKIEMEQKSMSSGGSVTQYVWYSPQVKNEVRQKFGGATGTWTINSQDTELKFYKVKTAGEVPGVR
jgi:hypothetical protein